jgi:micrococcal nuclease
MRYLTLALALACAFPALAEITRFVGEVVGLRDGDTLSIMQHGKAVTVRLHGIDTPEKGQAFGTRARQCTGALVFRQTVTVVVQDTDRYGRLVGEVLLPDGRSLNQELVRAGCAWWYQQYAPGDPTLARLEAEARAAKRGLWSDPHALAPWEWRRQQRTGTPAPSQPSFPPSPRPATPQTGCCRVCRTGKACGESCLAAGKTCMNSPGCVCQG